MNDKTMSGVRVVGWLDEGEWQWPSREDALMFGDVAEPLVELGAVIAELEGIGNKASDPTHLVLLLSDVITRYKSLTPEAPNAHE